VFLVDTISRAAWRVSEETEDESRPTHRRSPWRLTEHSPTLFPQDACPELILGSTTAKRSPPPLRLRPTTLNLDPSRGPPLRLLPDGTHVQEFEVPWSHDVGEIGYIAVYNNTVEGAAPLLLTSAEDSAADQEARRGRALLHGDVGGGSFLFKGRVPSGVGRKSRYESRAGSAGDPAFGAPDDVDLGLFGPGNAGEVGSRSRASWQVLRVEVDRLREGGLSLEAPDPARRWTFPCLAWVEPGEARTFFRAGCGPPESATLWDRAARTLEVTARREATTLEPVRGLPSAGPYRRFEDLPGDLRLPQPVLAGYQRGVGGGTEGGKRGDQRWTEDPGAAVDPGNDLGRRERRRRRRAARDDISDAAAAAATAGAVGRGGAPPPRPPVLVDVVREARVLLVERGAEHLARAWGRKWSSLYHGDDRAGSLYGEVYAVMPDRRTRDRARGILDFCAPNHARQRRVGVLAARAAAGGRWGAAAAKGPNSGWTRIVVGGKVVELGGSDDDDSGATDGIDGADDDNAAARAGRVGRPSTAQRKATLDEHAGLRGKLMGAAARGGGGGGGGGGPDAGLEGLEEDDDFDPSAPPPGAVVRGGWDVSRPALMACPFGAALPHVVRSDRWAADAEWGRALLQGADPHRFHVARTVPAAFGGLVQRDSPGHAVVEALLPPGSTLADEAAAGRLLHVDLGPGLAKPLTKLRLAAEVHWRFPDGSRDDRYFAPGAQMLLHVFDAASRSDNPLDLEDDVVPVPLAIVLDPRSDEKHRLFTLADDDWTWAGAKAFVGNSCALHTLAIEWYLRTVVVMEPVSLTIRRSLPAAHPVARLLQPFLADAVAANVAARGWFEGDGGLWDQCASVSTEGLSALMRAGWQGWAIESVAPSTILAGNGARHSPRVYPWREDSLALWNEMHAFVYEFLVCHYPAEDSPADDDELKAWYQDLSVEAFPFAKGSSRHILAPGFELMSDLVLFVTSVMWTCSARSTYLLEPLFEWCGHPATRPLKLGAPPPVLPGEIMSEEDLRAALPDVAEDALLLSVYRILSRPPSGAGATLSDCPHALLVGPAEVECVARHRKRLAHVERAIAGRNRSRSVPYVTLSPSNVRVGLGVYGETAAERAAQADAAHGKQVHGAGRGAAAAEHEENLHREVETVALTCVRPGVHDRIGDLGPPLPTEAPAARPRPASTRPLRDQMGGVLAAREAAEAAVTAAKIKEEARLVARRTALDKAKLDESGAARPPSLKETGLAARLGVGKKEDKVETTPEDDERATPPDNSEFGTRWDRLLVCAGVHRNHKRVPAAIRRLGERHGPLLMALAPVDALVALSEAAAPIGAVWKSVQAAVVATGAATMAIAQSPAGLLADADARRAAGHLLQVLYAGANIVPDERPGLCPDFEIAAAAVLEGFVPTLEMQPRMAPPPEMRTVKNAGGFLGRVAALGKAGGGGGAEEGGGGLLGGGVAKVSKAPRGPMPSADILAALGIDAAAADAADDLVEEAISADDAASQLTLAWTALSSQLSRAGLEDPMGVDATAARCVRFFSRIDPDGLADVAISLRFVNSDKKGGWSGIHDRAVLVASLAGPEDLRGVRWRARDPADLAPGLAALLSILAARVAAEGRADAGELRAWRECAPGADRALAHVAFMMALVAPGGSLERPQLHTPIPGQGRQGAGASDASRSRPGTSQRGFAARLLSRARSEASRGTTPTVGAIQEEGGQEPRAEPTPVPVDASADKASSEADSAPIIMAAVVGDLASRKPLTRRESQKAVMKARQGAYRDAADKETASDSSDDDRAAAAADPEGEPKWTIPADSADAEDLLLDAFRDLGTTFEAAGLAHAIPLMTARRAAPKFLGIDRRALAASAEAAVVAASAAGPAWAIVGKAAKRASTICSHPTIRTGRFDPRTEELEEACGALFFWVTERLENVGNSEKTAAWRAAPGAAKADAMLAATLRSFILAVGKPGRAPRVLPPQREFDNTPAQPVPAVTTQTPSFSGREKRPPKPDQASGLELGVASAVHDAYKSKAELKERPDYVSDSDSSESGTAVAGADAEAAQEDLVDAWERLGKGLHLAGLSAHSPEATARRTASTLKGVDPGVIGRAAEALRTVAEGAPDGAWSVVQRPAATLAALAKHPSRRVGRFNPTPEELEAASVAVFSVLVARLEAVGDERRTQAWWAAGGGSRTDAALMHLVEAFLERVSPLNKGDQVASAPSRADHLRRRASQRSQRIDPADVAKNIADRAKEAEVNERAAIESEGSDDDGSGVAVAATAMRAAHLRRRASQRILPPPPPQTEIATAGYEGF